MMFPATPQRESRHATTTRRTGVTLVEVLFSIGVILIGLVSLLSLLPVAGFQARDTVSLNRGTAVAASMIDRMRSHHYHENGRLLVIGESTDANRVDTTQLLNLPTNMIVPGFSPLTYGEGMGICIDPIFASGHTVPTPGNVVANGYSGAFFPYYKANHNPLVNPLAASSSPALAWPTVQPRLRRAGVLNPMLPPANGVWPNWNGANGSPLTYIDADQSRLVTESGDDLPVTRTSDRAAPAQFTSGQLQALPTTNSLSYGKRISTGDFSTIVTVSPLSDGVYASVTTVVIRGRDRSFEVPTFIDATADDDDNAQAERLAMVAYANGFHGGAGGIAHLTASSATDASLNSGDWVMLSRRIPTGLPTPAFRDVHRWYRVSSVSGKVNGKAETFTITGGSGTVDANLNCFVPDNASNQEVWRLKVLLDGPDWEFGFNNALGASIPYADNTFLDNTMATLVQNVVSVTESTIRMDEL